MKFSTSAVIAVLATGVLATPAKETNIFSSIENERNPAQDTQPTANMKSGEMALLICGRNKACRLMTNNGSCYSLDTWWADDRVATLDLNIMPTNTCCFYQQLRDSKCNGVNMCFGQETRGMRIEKGDGDQRDDSTGALSCSPDSK